jgi:hypothetical protein
LMADLGWPAFLSRAFSAGKRAPYSLMIIQIDLITKKPR